MFFFIASLRRIYAIFHILFIQYFILYFKNNKNYISITLYKKKFLTILTTPSQLFLTEKKLFFNV